MMIIDALRRRPSTAAVLLTLWLLASCGSSDETVETESPDVVQTDSLFPPRLGCTAAEGTTGADLFISAEEAGTPTLQEALTERLDSTLPGIFSGVPIDDLLIRDSADQVGFYVSDTKTDDGDQPIEHFVAYRGLDRIEAYLHMSLTEKGGWVVDSFEICNEFYDGSA